MAHPLNPAQRRAVQHVEGPLLVLAGPGSGKTRVVTNRIAYLLKRGVRPEEILAVTFTNKAAREMRERVKKLTGGSVKGLTIATFHSACVRILREEIEALGYGKNFSIYDQGSQQALMRSVLTEMGGEGSTRSASHVLGHIGDAKNLTAEAGAPAAAAPPADDGVEPEDPTLAEAADAEAAFLLAARDCYELELQARNAVDFDDLILLTGRLFRDHPAALRRWRTRYRFLLVDEYQDTNPAQDEVLSLLAAEHRNLCVVGDDDQSIYGWRGADIRLILDFAERWPGANVVRLEQNYRSSKHIVAAARSVIEHNPKRHEKKLFTRRRPGQAVRVAELDDEEQEAEFIAREIADALRGADKPYRVASRYAVLFRTNEQMRPLEQALRQASVPYRLLGGRSFFDRKEVQDVMAYLRAAANSSDDEAILRAINTPARGLGAKAKLALRAEAQRTRAGLWGAIEATARGQEIAGLSARARAATAEFAEICSRLRRAASARQPTLVSELLERIDYRGEVERSYKDDAVRGARWNMALETEKAWQHFLERSSANSLDGFLDAMALRDRDEDDGDGEGATLATIHASKGLEFPIVFVAGLEEGILPHKRSVDDGRELAEERRVFFVALTRAQDQLTVTRALQRTRRGQQTETIPSRFLEELADDVTEAFDPKAPASGDVAVDRLAQMRALLGPS